MTAQTQAAQQQGQQQSQQQPQQQTGSSLWVNVLLLMLPPLFWSGNIIVGRAVHEDVYPVALAFYRWLMASVLLLPFAWQYLRRDLKHYWHNRWLIIGLSITGITIYNTLIYLGLQTTAATNGFILNSFIPMLIVLLGALFFHTPVRPLQLVGMLISFSGVVTIVIRADFSVLTSLAFAKGDLIILLALLSWALYTLWLKQVPAEINRTGLLSLQMALGMIFLLPFYLWEAATHPPLEWNSHALAALAYVGLVPSLLAYLLYNACVVRLGPARAGLSIHLMPVFGVLLSVSFLNEQLHLYHALGIGLIFGGILLATLNRKQAQ